MKIELHVIQNFPVHCLNRDDTNTPKDCEFGGVRRARISSQSLKRAMRDYFKVEEILEPDQRAVRTKRMVERVVERLVELGHDATRANELVDATLKTVKLKVERKKDQPPKTQYLIYLPERDLRALTTLVHEHWSAVDEAVGPRNTGVLPKELAKEVQGVLVEAKGTPELALFGRMIANNPDWNMEASCQVAHAISTHRVTMDFDFYTAVDDLKPDDTSGADMMGTIPFNSACFYRYAVVDVDDLRANLDSADGALVRRTVDAFMRGFVGAVPSGKQNSMAAHTRPSHILAVTRERGEPCMLSNAFVKPVRPSEHKEGGDLVSRSVEALEQHYDANIRMYGARGVRAAVTCALGDNVYSQQADRVGDFETLIARTLDAAFSAEAL